MKLTSRVFKFLEVFYLEYFMNLRKQPFRFLDCFGLADVN